MASIDTDRQVCESCRITDATTSWPHPATGAPFQLCGGCALLVPAVTASTTAGVR
jgi:hypothetical protein